MKGRAKRTIKVIEEFSLLKPAQQRKYILELTKEALVLITEIFLN